jgi:hypothetical protein
LPFPQLTAWAHDCKQRLLAHSTATTPRQEDLAPQYPPVAPRARAVITQ